MIPVPASCPARQRRGQASSLGPPQSSLPSQLTPCDELLDLPLDLPGLMIAAVLAARRWNGLDRCHERAILAVRRTTALRDPCPRGVVAHAGAGARSGSALREMQ